MDRISVLRNIEQALQDFESGEADLAATEQHVQTILRTYATEFEGDNGVFQATGDAPVDGRVVVAPSQAAARERLRTLADAPEADFEIERLD